ncbi:hypothetical protein BH11PAT4_BH11PAT4_7180 [soil metagenome]
MNRKRFGICALLFSLAVMSYGQDPLKPSYNLPNGWKIIVPSSALAAPTYNLAVKDIPTWVSPYGVTASWRRGDVLVVKQKDKDLQEFSSLTYWNMITHKIMFTESWRAGRRIHVGFYRYNDDGSQSIAGWNLDHKGKLMWFDTSARTTQLSGAQTRARNSGN